jgi:crotonobetainyl-CoA:carnitine CoA-transferase CaiB-like acyl-CoA transferase
MLADPRFATNEGRVVHALELDAAICQAIGARTLAENVQIIEQHQLTACPVQTVADAEQDPHWRARQLTVDVGDNGLRVRMHNIVPRLSATPGRVQWAGGALGQDNQRVYHGLGVSCDELQQLSADGVI